MNSYSVPVCICIDLDLLVHCIQLLKVEYISVLEEKDLKSLRLSLCDSWKGAMMFSCFIPQKIQSAAVYDR